MQRTLFLVIFLFAAFLCRGQKEHLEPAKDLAKNINSEIKDRYDSVHAQLYTGFSFKPYARYTVMSGIANQMYAISVEQKDGKSVILSNTLIEDHKTWMVKNNRLITRKAEIGQELYKEIGILLHLLAEQTSASGKQILGLDGTDYYFAVTDSSSIVKTGKIWSPHKHSLMSRVVKVCDVLYAIGNGGNVNQARIVKQLEQLVADLKLNNY